MQPHGLCVGLAEGVLMSWFATITKPNHEFSAAEQIRSAGLGAYVPAVQSVRQRSDRRVTVHTPIFPGYAFVQFDERDEFLTRSARNEVLGCHSVGRFITSGLALETIPDAEIDAVRLMLASELPCMRVARLVPGMRVKITGGPLVGLHGTLTRQQSAQYVWVKVAMFNSSVGCEVESCFVEPAAAQASEGMAHRRIA